GKSQQELLGLAAQKIEKLTQSVRVDVERLDKLMNLVGELVIDRNRLQQIGLSLRDRHPDDDTMDDLTEAARHMGHITDDLQAEVMRIRMLPIENVFNKFPRMVRGLAQKLDKKVEFVIEGQETELDRSVLEKIDDPIIHLLRNAIDHGLEPPAERTAAGKANTGLIKLSARQEENHIVIAVQDDGRGIDPERVKAAAVRKGIVSQDVADRMDDRSATELVFAPGFSTAAATTDLSGRGVGMDIVRTNIEKLSGTVSIESAVGQGTTFVVKLPLTLAIIRALLVTAGGRKFAFPMTAVVETIRVNSSRLEKLGSYPAIRLRGKVLPVAPLRQLLSPGAGWARQVDQASNVRDLQPRRNGRCVVAVQAGDRQLAVEVDSFIGQTDIVIKPLSEYLGD
ncbi:MAG: chemotaxis protein CheA, partial [Chloroflexota bacterium]|nr:chemotaxis protein CheA [Chloroflexota bacterium]